MITVRHGLMILGETISCKTNSYKILAKALNIKDNENNVRKYLSINTVFLISMLNIIHIYTHPFWYKTG